VTADPHHIADTMAASQVVMPVPVRAAGRYTLGEVLGRGGSGTVYRARDELGLRDVALKLLRPGPDTSAARVRREVAALRLLRLPGVVALLDEGEHAGSRFLVMELVEGAPFPGAFEGQPGWALLEATALALLDVLQQVHAAGVVHRDLKPSNVLVDRRGLPTLLDFGLSAGEVIGKSLTTAGVVLGTPAYLAPEQAFGRRADLRADLYAVGLMLYEALSGELPHHGDDLHQLLIQRATQPVTPLRQVAPGVPPHVADVVDRLLALDPAARPASAAAVRSALAGRTPASEPERRQLPWLGGDGTLDACRAQLAAGRSVDVVGGRGFGRSHLLRRLGDALAEGGREVLRLRIGQRPFASLEGIGAPLDAISQLGLPDAQAALAAFLGEALGADGVVLADDWEQVDRWTRELVVATVRPGALVRVCSPAATDPGRAAVIALAPLSQADLVPLFAGPRRLLHLPDDAAEELWARTGGRPTAVVDEVARWLRLGIAARDDEGRLRVEREALARLRLAVPAWLPGTFAISTASTQSSPSSVAVGAVAAEALRGNPHLDEVLVWITLLGPHAQRPLVADVCALPPWLVEACVADLVDIGAVREDPARPGHLEPLLGPDAMRPWTEERRAAAHRAIAAHLPPGERGRFYHLVASGAYEAVGAEAVVLVEHLTLAGQLEEAFAVGREALLILRQVEVTAAEEQVLVALTHVAQSDSRLEVLERLAYELARAARTPLLDQLQAFVQASCEVARSGGEGTLRMIEALPEFARPALEVWRQSLRVRAARSAPLAREEAVVAEACAWAAGHADAIGTAPCHGWLGRLRFRQERYLEAVDSHARAAAADRFVAPRLSAMLNAASALVEARAIERASAVAEEARELAAQCRHTYFEARATWLLRSCAYRMCRDDAPDLELVALIDAVGVPYLSMLVWITEGGFAWRRGDVPRAHALAEQAATRARTLGLRWPALSCEAWAAALGDGYDQGEAAAMATRFAECTDAGILIQGLGLVALAAPAVDPAWRGLATAAARDMPADQHDARLDIISPSEGLAFLHLGRQKTPGAAAFPTLDASLRPPAP
jgi:hypothetical protein